MARKEKNIHYIYKTTCNVTGKWYVGMHSTINENDGYLGSGKILRHSIRKYGKDNHNREILEYLETRELLVLRETEIVTKELIGDGLCMNLKEGGSGGFANEEHIKKFNEGREWGRLIGNRNAADLVRGTKFSEDHIKKIFLSRKKHYEDNVGPFDGKSHNEETKKLMSEAKKGKCDGENNPSFGTCWIMKDDISKKIKKEDLEAYFQEGWTQGRKMK